MEAKDGSFGFELIGIYDEVVLHKRLAYTMEDGRKVITDFPTCGTMAGLWSDRQIRQQLL
jgi:hypothetical protein